MSNVPSLLEMLKAGAHFGHQKSRWHPKMEQYLFGQRNGVHIIDLEKTQAALVSALKYVKTLAANGKVILFVGTKRQARGLIKAAAESCGMPYVTERWIGGLLTNFDEFKRRLKKYLALRQMIDNGEIGKYTKKEQSVKKKQLLKMDKYLSGLTSLATLPDALYVADLKVEKTAVTEAAKTNVPIVAVCDSNVNPDKAAYPIPANDDAVQAIKLMAELIAAAVNEGKKDFEKNKDAFKAEELKKTAKVMADTEEKFDVTKIVSSNKPVEKIERRAIRTQEVV